MVASAPCVVSRGIALMDKTIAGSHEFKRIPAQSSTSKLDDDVGYRRASAPALSVGFDPEQPHFTICPSCFINFCK